MQLEVKDAEPPAVPSTLLPEESFNPITTHINLRFKIMAGSWRERRLESLERDQLDNSRDRNGEVYYYV